MVPMTEGIQGIGPVCIPGLLYITTNKNYWGQEASAENSRGYLFNKSS